MSTASSHDLATSPRRPRRTLMWLRRGVLALLALWLALTMACLAYNAATAPPERVPADGGLDVSVAGVRVHYRHWGTHGSPIVLVHGLVESTVAWEPTGRVLSQTHTVYALDLAGYGYTDYTGRYGLDDEVALVDGFVRTLGLDHPVLVGHSLGAAVVGGVALQHPSDIGGVIFADGDALPFSKDGRGGRAPSGLLTLPYITSAYRLITSSTGLGERAIAGQCGSTCRALTPELAEAWLRPLRQGAAERSLPAIARNGVLHLTPEEIRRITVPRAILWGAEDARSGGSLAEAQHNLGDPPTRIVPAAGHLPMVADPEGFAADVAQLVADPAFRA